MNDAQKIWWIQTQSEYRVLLLLRKSAAHPCHQLHYLQMVSEKLGKAYFWRTGTPPAKSHTGFVTFLRALHDRPSADGVRIAPALGFPRPEDFENRPSADGVRIAPALGFPRPEDFENWIRSVLPLAHELERLAPALAGNTGPNPEYPWPQHAPRQAPCQFSFGLWSQLNGTGRGRHLLKFIGVAVENFRAYA